MKNFISMSMHLALVFCSLTLSAQTPENLNPLNAEPGEKWQIKWNRSDDFGRPGDPEGNVDYTKWERNPQHVQTWTWDNENNCKQKDGILSISARFDDAGADRSIRQNCGGLKTDLFYTSGILKSFASGTYGYYEARIKGAELFPGVSPAFWMFSDIDDTITEEGVVRYSEVDVVEMTQKGTKVPGNEMVMDHNLHSIVATRFKVGLNGYTFLRDANGNKIPLNARDYTTKMGRRWYRPGNPELREAQENVTGKASDPNRFDPRKDFHYYGCKITPEWITWYVDRREIGRKRNDKWHRSMKVALSLGIREPYTIFCNNSFALPERDFALANQDKFPQTMQVDYVRVWELDDSSTTSTNPKLEVKIAEQVRLTTEDFVTGSTMSFEMDFDAGTGFVAENNVSANLILKDASNNDVKVYEGVALSDATGTRSGTIKFNIDLKESNINAIPTANLNPGEYYIIAGTFKSSKEPSRNVYLPNRIEGIKIVATATTTRPDTDDDIIVHPNPINVGDVLNIELKKSNKKIKFSLVDLAGEVVFSKNFRRESNLSIPLNSINSGIYFVKIEIKNNVFLKRIVVN